MARQALVIGGTGFLGTAIVRELIDGGWQVTSLGRGRQPNRVPGARFVAVDRSQPGALVAATAGQTIDLVVDGAAYQAPDAAEAVAAFAGKTGHYVFISTDFVYSPRYEGPYPIDIDAPKEDALPYGTGKLACEAVLTRAWEERRFPFTALRPPHIMGAGKPLGGGSLQGRDPHLLSRMRAGTDLTLIAEGQHLIQPVWNREIGAAISHFAGNERAFGRVFTGAGPECVTIRRYYELIAEWLGVPLRYDSVTMAECLPRRPDLAPFARHRIYDPRPLEEATGYRPHLSLRDAIAETAAWMEQVETV